MAHVKITAIETILDPDRPLLLWVRVHTDAGLVGLGETFQSPDATARVIHGTLAKVLLGQPALANRRRTQSDHVTSLPCRDEMRLGDTRAPTDTPATHAA